MRVVISRLLIKRKTCVSRLLRTLSLCDCAHCLLLACWRRVICAKESCKSGIIFLALFYSQGAISSEISFLASSRFVRASEREVSGYTPGPVFCLTQNMIMETPVMGTIRMYQQEHASPVSEFISLVSGLCSPDFCVSQCHSSAF